jgi:AAA-like domain/CHAT domain
MNSKSVTKILFLAANPKNSTRLRLDEELREIDEGLLRATHRDRYELEQKWAVRPGDLQRAIGDLSPQIVHFSGHGLGIEDEEPSASNTRKLSAVPEVASEPEGLMFEDDAGQGKLVGTKAIADLFSLYSDRIECVVLNACYSAKQAEAIAQHIPYVIGMSRAVGDKAARVFAVGFYDALGAGRDFEFAYKSGCVAIQMAGIPEELTPVLRRQSDLLKLGQPEVQGNVKLTVSLESPAGKVRIDSGFYIASPYEDRCYEEVRKPGSLIRIKSPHKMGKSSLMARVLAQVEQLGDRTVMIDLEQTNQKVFDDLDKFMQWFCASVGKALAVRVKTEDYWDDIFGANDNSTDYFEKYLLTDEGPPLVLAIDNFDRVFKYPDIETDFCGLLRGWHERSKIKKQWEKLRLIVVHSQESYAQKDINQSPFNVGLPIELGEFTPTQVRELAVRHGLSWMEGEFAQLMRLIGGHPYMVRTALYYIASGDFSLAEFLKTAPTEAGVYSDLLRGHLKALEDCPELGTAMKKVADAEGSVSLRSEDAFKLDSMGLVVREENNVKPRCDLYRQYFQGRLEANAVLVG